MRQAKFAGLFYEKGEVSLKNQIEGCFLDKRGPGALPIKHKKSSIQAIIAPHAGYIYSGPCAAWSYSDLAKMELADLFIIIGPSYLSHESGFSMETYETPLGMIRVEQQFARMLSEKGNIKQNKAIFEGEHCIEVQLPFLQYIYKKQAEKIKILPILLSHDADLKALALDLKELLVDTGKKVVFIISSDFTHYGRNYHHVPFSTDVKQKIYDLDGEAIELIKKMDSKGFADYVKKNMMTICGSIPIQFLLEMIDSNKIKLNQYYTSGDISKDYKNSVSYASITFF